MLKRVAIVFGVALALYAGTYYGIEHQRTRKGPWQITFAQDRSGAPCLAIRQPFLAITNVLLLFPGEAGISNFSGRTLVFDQPRPVPFEVPFGKCLFMDTTFLPGTVVLELFKHEVQLMPRALTIDKQERSWQPGATVSLSPVPSVPRNPSPLIQQ